MPHPSRRFAVALGLCTVGVCLAWSVLAPILTGPDEDAHLDLVYEQARTGEYPLTARYRVNAWVRHAGREAYEYDQDHLHHRWIEAEATSRADRARVDELTPGRAGINQLTQHPPGGWLPAVVATAVAERVVAISRWPYDRFVLLGRWASALVLVVVPGALLAGARRLGAPAPVAIAAAASPLAVPQLTYIGGMLSNDTLLVAAAALSVPLVARVLRGDTSSRTAALLGLVLAGALLTKAFAIPLSVCAIAAYALVPGTSTRDLGRSVRAAALTSGVAFVGGGWWWVRNLVVEGVVQPERAPFHGRPAGFVALSGADWSRRYLAWLTTRSWGWFGHFASEIRLPIALVAVATASVVIGVLAAGAFGTSVQRRFTALAVAELVVCVLAVASTARRLHVEHGVNSGIQGRYLFAALPALAVSSVIGWSRLVERLAPTARRARPEAAWWLPVAVVVAAVVLQANAAWALLRGYWGPPHAGLITRLGAMLAWSPAPPWAVGLIVAGTVAAGIVALRSVASVASTWPDDAESLAP